MQQLMEGVTSVQIERALQSVKDARGEIERFEGLKTEALEQCNSSAYQRYSDAINIWDKAREQREEYLVDLLLKSCPEDNQS